MDKKGVIRDSLAKLNKISEDTWEDILDRYELEYSQDHLRKMAYGMKMYSEAMDEEMSNEQLIEIKKQKVQLQDLRTNINRKIRQYARIEDLIENIKQECKKMDNFTLVDTDKVEIFENGSDSILVISDVHWDGRKDTIYKFNKMIDFTINKCKLHKINKLIVFLGGDLINNEFHSTSRIENREGIAYQLVNTAKLVSDGLHKLSENIPYVCVGMVTGNHGRSIENYKDSMTTDNYLPVMDELIKLRLENIHNIIFLENVEDDDRFCVIDVKGKTYVLTHGDVLKKLKKNSISEVEAFLRIKIDYLILGHFHQIQDMMYFDKRIIVNGALTNDFDYAKGKLLNTPCYQRLLMLDSTGDVECTYDIKL